MTRMPEVEDWRRQERKRLIAARMALDPELHRQWSLAIAGELAALLASYGGLVLGFYWPVRAEFDPRPLADRLVGQGANLGLPAIVDRGRPLEYRLWRPGMAVTEGLHGIAAPEPGQPVQPGLVLAPLVGFDGENYRLGYGGGYFDRTLAALQPRPVAIGIGFEAARLPTVFPQPHDAPMDLIVTEAGVQRRRGSS